MRRSRGIAAAALVSVLALVVCLLIGQPASAASESLFGSTVPATKADTDTVPVTLGTKVTANVAGKVTGVRFYKASTNTGTHVAAVYNGDGSLSIKGNFANETTSGWQTWTPATALNVTAGTSFVVAVYMPKGRYASQGSYAWPKQTASLTGTGGAYSYGTGIKFPVTAGYQGASYFIDVNFTPDVVPSPTPTVTPTSISPSPTPTDPPTSESPSPTPSQTTPPPTGGWSTAGVTAGVTLSRVPQDVSSGTGWRSDSAGNVTATANGAVLSGLLIPGRVDVSSFSGARITNVRVQCINENDWCLSIGTGSTVTNVEIGGQANGTTYGHAVGMWTGGSDTAGNVIDHVLIHHQISGIRLDGGTTVTNSYIRDLPMGDPVKNFATGQTNTDDHSGGIMATTNGNVVVRGSRIEGGNTANLFVQHDVTNNNAPAIHDWLIEGNEFANVAKNGEVCSFGVRVENKPNTPGPFTIRNNAFTRGWEVSPILSDVPNTTRTGNTYTDGTTAD